MMLLQTRHGHSPHGRSRKTIAAITPRNYLVDFLFQVPSICTLFHLRLLTSFIRLRLKRQPLI